MNFFSELKRRNVYKVAVAYAVVGWLVVQVATQTFPFFEVPNWSVRLVILLVVIGFPIALIIAWARQFPGATLVLYGRVALRGRQLIKITLGVAILFAIYFGPVVMGPELVACTVAAGYPRSWLRR